MDISRWDWTIWQYPVTTLTEGGGSALSPLSTPSSDPFQGAAVNILSQEWLQMSPCVCVRGRRWQQGGDSPAVIIILEGQ